MPAPDSSFDQLLGRLAGVKTVLVCDPEGAILLCAGDASCEPRLQARATASSRKSAQHSRAAPHTPRSRSGYRRRTRRPPTTPASSGSERAGALSPDRFARRTFADPALSLQPILPTAPVPRRHMTAFCDDCAVVHASCSPIVLSLLVRFPPPPPARRHACAGGSRRTLQFFLSLPARSSCARSGLHAPASAPAGARGVGRRTDPRRAARAG